MDNRQRILVMAEHAERLGEIQAALFGVDHELIVAPIHSSDLALEVRQSHPDVLIMQMTAPSPGMLKQWRYLLSEQTLPLIVFAERGDSRSVRAAVEAGVSAYVVDGLKSERVLLILEAALARFRAFQALREQRDEAIERLGERRDIERAKGILMYRRELSEQAAYQALRKMAMDRGARLIDVAQSVITVENLLVRK